MDQVQALVNRHFSSSGDELIIGGIPVSELAERHGTPLFIYDRAVVEKKYALLRAALPEEFSICYSMKANPSQAILRALLALGAGIEIASAGEFVQAVTAGCPAGEIIFAGPGKTESELELVLKSGIGEVHMESPREAGRISAISERLGVRAPVALRVNPGGEAEGGAMRMGGRPAPFGVDEETLDEVLDYVLALPGIEFRGLHLFAGTQILDFETLVTQYRKGIEIARRVAARLKRPLHTLDFGGGLGIPYFPHEQELDLGKLREALQKLMTEVRGESLFSGTRFIVEPGRYLVGEAGVYVVRVTDIKISRGKKFLIVDGGMNHHLAASGNLGQTIKRNYPSAILQRMQEPPDAAVDVVGPLCTPLDVLGRAVALPAATVGDLIGIFQSGAYGRSASPLGFLGHSTPPEVWVHQGQDSLIRRRGEFSDYLQDQRIEVGTTPAPVQ